MRQPACARPEDGNHRRPDSSGSSRACLDVARQTVPGLETTMPREAIAFTVPDVSAFARALGKSLAERHARKPAPPSHVELLNMLARAAGQRNMQALRAAPVASAAIAAPSSSPMKSDTPLSANARKALAQFDDSGRLLRWPVKYSVQRLVIWTLWTRFDAKRVYTEKEVNAVLKQANDFGDHVTLRRELINHLLMARKSDCSEYRKLAARPDDEARALIAAWRKLHT
jgi:hypothetical protein